jgi:hypothetical protein
MNESTSQFEGYDHGLNPDIQTTLAEQLQKLYAGATSVEDMLNELQKTTDASLAK